MNVSLKTIVLTVGVACLLLAIGNQSRRMQQLEDEVSSLRAWHNGHDAWLFFLDAKLAHLGRRLEAIEPQPTPAEEPPEVPRTP